MSEQVFIGLGSNLQNPIKQVQTGIVELNQIQQTQCLACSSLYRSAPVGPVDQPDYINAVALLATDLAPLALLDALQVLEQKHNRVRKKRWGPRTLDLDILLYGNQQIHSDRLTVPHRHLHERMFVLQPMSEIAPDLDIVGLGTLTALLETCADKAIKKIG